LKTRDRINQILMKKIYFLLLLLPASLLSFCQLTGIKSIPGDYASVSAAVTDLNIQGVGPGGVVFNVATGYTETLSAALVVTITTNPSSASRPVLFQRSGAGANPMITAFTPGASTTVDGIFIINGADYITINGIDLQENSSNTTATQQMEWGYALVKTSTSNGSQYNTIKNCSVTLNKANTASVGIYSGNHIITITTALTVNNFAGTNSYNKYYNNTIQNCFHGIDLNGYVAAAAPYDYYDKANEIGTTGTGRNQILNFGGGATGTVNGITCNAQNLVKIFNTNIDNSGGAATSTTMNGILTGTGTNANVDIYNDTITLSSSATTSALNGINNTSGGTGAGNNINIYNCVVSNCSYTTATSGEFRGISGSATASYYNLYNNTVSNNTLSGSGTLSAIFMSASSATLVLNISVHDNTANANTRTGATGNLRVLNIDATAAAINAYNNIVTNNSNSASSGTTNGYYDLAGVGFVENVYNNQIYNLTGGTGETIALYASSGPIAASSLKRISGNLIHDITANTTGFTGGIFHDYCMTSNTYQNTIYNITNNTATGGTPAVFGIRVGTNNGIQTFINNNFISELKAPNASNVSAIRGLSLEGSAAASMYVYHNTIYLNATSTGANFGTTPVFCSSGAISHDLRNNIFADASTPAGTGRVIAIQRNIATLTNYNLLSGHNCLYAGTPGANNLVFYDGTNADQTAQAMKNRVGPREQASFSEIPPFISLVSPFNLHLQTGAATQCESGGQPVAIVTTDFDGNTRNVSTPDAGADEAACIMNDIASPDIQYALLLNSDAAASRTVTAFATITDPSGINTTAGTNPRFYYKKSTDGNTFNDNTNATDGWKYVEASNATSPFNFTIDYSLLFGGGGVTAGNIIQYFVTVQDLNATPRSGLNNGGFTTQPTSVNLTAANFPLNNTINQYTIVANAFTGVIPVGPTEAITSLTNAGGIFSLINAGVLKGNVTISITGDLTAETGANAINQWAETDGTGYTVSIVPSAGVPRTISGSHAALSLVRMDGADRVMIDGRFGGSGNFLTFRNTSNTAPTIGLINDAQNNTVRNCIIESGNTSTAAATAGTVFFGTTTGLQGNDNNTITENDIRDRSDVAGTPVIAIHCTGNVTSPAHANSGNTISNNNIHDWFLVNSSAQFGINIGTGNTNFSITGNSFYQTVTRSHTAAGGVTRAININNASAANTLGGYTISGNFIGGTAPGATGGDWTLTSTSTQTFGAISVTTSLLPSIVQNNVITKINYSSIAPAANTTMFSGISVTQGNINVQNNTIGAATGTGAIAININTGGTGSSFLAGVLSAATNGTHNVTGNTIGGWTLAGTNTVGSYIPQYIQVQGTPTQNFSISNNVIGSTSTANSIQNILTTAPCVSFGIRLLITTGPSVTISNNIIQNITDLSAATTSADYGMLLINQVGGNAPLIVTNNTITNFTGNALSATATINVYGISMQGYSGTGHLFSGNTISALSNTNPGAGSGYTMGIQVQGAASGGTMSKNKVFNLNNANTGAGAGISGLYFSVGDGWTVTNNMVSINNGAGTNALNIYGIAEYCTGSFTMFYNSVYVGGTGSGTLNTYAYERGNSSRLNLKNNLLYNERTGGTGFHYAAGNTIAVPSDSWTSSSSAYNTFIASNAAAIGEWGTGVSQTFAQWKTSSGGDNESYFETAVNVPSSSLFNNVTNGDLRINTANAESWYVNGKAIAGSLSNSISSDYEGTIRGITEGEPTDIGADEFATGAGVLPPDATASAAPSPSTTTVYTFGGRKLGEIVWGASVPTSVSWKYYSGIPGPLTTGAVINSYHDVPAVGTAPFNYDMKLYYTLAEQNQIPDAELSGIKKDGANPWLGTGGMASSDGDGKFVTSTGLNSFSLFSLKSVLNTLPLKLISFTGNMNTNNAIDLTWEVTEQSDIQKYIVEKSGDAITYNSIGTVTANTANRFTYNFTDAHPITGKNYYRLRIVEADNDYEYSKSILFIVGSKASLVIYPQPASDHITIQVGRPGLVNTMMLLTDISGKTVKNIRLTSQVQDINISSLPAGMYFFRTNDGDSYKIIKQ
jgi:hypothetical protein